MSYRSCPKFRNLYVHVNMSVEEVYINYEKIKRDLQYNDVPSYELFRPYLKHFYNTDISRTTMHKIKYDILKL
jgi:hypothetical protein